MSSVSEAPTDRVTDRLKHPHPHIHRHSIYIAACLSRHHLLVLVAVARLRTFCHSKGSGQTAAGCLDRCYCLWLR